MTLGHDDSTINIVVAIIIIFFFDPGTQFPRNEKITLCNILLFTEMQFIDICHVLRVSVDSFLTAHVTNCPAVCVWHMGGMKML